MTPPESGRSGGLAIVGAATVLLALKGIFVRLAFEAGMETLAIIAWRVALASPAFWLVGWSLGRGTGGVDGASPGSRRAALAAVGCGGFYAVAVLADFIAIERLGASVSRLVLFTFPGFLMALDAVVAGRRPTRRELGGAGLAWTGLGLVMTPGLSSAGPGDVPALVWGLVAAATYAVYLFLSQPLTRSLGTARFAALANVGTFTVAALVLPAFLTPADMVAGGAEAIGWSVALALLSTVLAFLLLFEGIRRLGAVRAGLLSLLGPPITLTAAWAILGERLGVIQLVGAAVVVVAMGVLRATPTRPA